MKWIIVVLLPFGIALVYSAFRISLEVLGAWKGERQTTARGRTIRAALRDLLITLIMVGCIFWTIWFVLVDS